VISHAAEWLTFVLVLAVLWIVGAIPVGLYLGRRLRELDERGGDALD
jgi:hypothetical protein